MPVGVITTTIIATKIKEAYAALVVGSFADGTGLSALIELYLLMNNDPDQKQVINDTMANVAI